MCSGSSAFVRKEGIVTTTMASRGSRNTMHPPQVTGAVGAAIPKPQGARLSPEGSQYLLSLLSK